MSTEASEEWNVVLPRFNRNSIQQHTSDGSVKSSTASEQGYDARTCHGVLFVGGLAWQTTEDSLRSYFRRYGPLQSVVVMTGRGFGFVYFRNPGDAEKALQNAGQHFVDNKFVEYVTFDL